MKNWNVFLYQGMLDTTIRTNTEMTCADDNADDVYGDDI